MATQADPKPTMANSWTVSNSDKGEFVRKPTQFRRAISQAANAAFPVESGRYHLYVSLACPWAHRTLITRALKGLEDHISVTVVDPYLTPTGWHFSNSPEIGCTPDPLNGFKLLREVYELADPEYAHHYTVPVLFDKKTNTIVNNESAEIIRMLNSEFNSLSGRPDLDLYPERLHAAIDEINGWVYPNINNGVYRCGFATSQSAYEKAFDALFDHLDRCEAILESKRFLTGDRLTEADVRLFTTLLRFDPVYFTHFKTNKRRIIEYPNLWAYVRDIYQTPGVAETCNMHHIKHHYFRSHTQLNPKQIVPLGPDLDLSQPHGRTERFGGAQSAL